MPTRQVVVEVLPPRGKRLAQPLTRLQDHRVEIEEGLKQLGIRLKGHIVPSWSREAYSLTIPVGEVGTEVQGQLGTYLNDFFELEFGSDARTTVKLIVTLVQPRRAAPGGTAF